MSTELIGTLFRLRYKLMWARTRTRNGKIALFFAGYLLFVLAVSVLAGGGIGSAMLAVRSGKAQLVAQIVLTAVFFQSLLTTVIMGFGLNAMFSDTELRRYPVNAAERTLARHLVGIADPFWFLSLALEFGLAIGLYAMGAAGFWQGMAAVLPLFVCNYLSARVLALLVDRLMQQRAGSVLLLASVMLLSIGLGSLGQLVKHNAWLSSTIVQFLGYTPPFAAAALMTGGGKEAFYGAALETWWLLVLAGALVALERRPAVRQSAESAAEVSWGNGYERAARLCGPELAPLVAHWLRFYARNNRFRTIYVLTLPLAGFITFNLGRRGEPHHLFLAALGTFPMVTFLAPSRFTVNLFGYAGGAFRRYFLLPVKPAEIMRAGSYASMLLGASLIPLAALAWVALAPVPFDPRQLFMLLASAFSALFIMHGLGLWATLYGPRRGNYNQALGNDLSLMGNLVLIGGMLCFLLLPQFLDKSMPVAVQPDSWWLAAAPVLAGLAFYTFSLRTAGQLLRSRREQLMAVVEGRA